MWFPLHIVVGLCVKRAPSLNTSHDLYKNNMGCFLKMEVFKVTKTNWRCRMRSDFSIRPIWAWIRKWGMCVRRNRKCTNIMGIAGLGGESCPIKRKWQAIHVNLPLLSLLVKWSIDWNLIETININMASHIWWWKIYINLSEVVIIFKSFGEVNIYWW